MDGPRFLEILLILPLFWEKRTIWGELHMGNLAEFSSLPAHLQGFPEEEVITPVVRYFSFAPKF